MGGLSDVGESGEVVCVPSCSEVRFLCAPSHSAPGWDLFFHFKSLKHQCFVNISAALTQPDKKGINPDRGGGWPFSSPLESQVPLPESSAH